MKKFQVFWAALLCLSVSLVGCGAQYAVDAHVPEVQATVEPSEEVMESGRPYTVATREYNAEGQVRSLLTGKFVDKEIGERRPVAIMLSNIKEAQPMAGVGSADIVYECPVEGEITRFMGVFEDYDDLEKIGSARSCRDYFLYYALEFDAVYAHYGQSAYAVEPLSRDYVDNLSGLAAIGNTVYYRTDDRPMPHNAYASANGIKEGIRKLKYRTNYREDYAGKFAFAGDGEIISLEETGGTRLEPGYFINKPWFEYNASDKKYYRFQYGGPQIDDLTGEQLAFTNVIFQYSDWLVRDEKDYLSFDCHGDGYALIFTNGTLQEAHWYREGTQENGSIRYYNLGLTEEIKLNQGKTMVCIIEDYIDGEMNPYVKIQ